jgi:hypothetical protein
MILCVPQSGASGAELREAIFSCTDKMVRLKDVEGKIYHFKSKSKCVELGILGSVVSDIVRFHMVLVLDIVPERTDYVKCMTVGA